MTTKKKICVLEDDQDIREIIAFLLETEHYEVSTYSNCKSFLSEAPKFGADVFILDVMLPDGNGINICNKLNEDDATRSTPVVMMSANYAPSDVLSTCHAADFIKKPFDIGNFVDRISAQAYQ